MTAKKTNIALVTNSKEMKIYDLPDKEFKIIILKKLSEMQENIDKQIKLGKQYMNKMSMKFNKQKP